jgi:aminoglycoside 2'-N-acetyltransferase I
VRRLCDRAYATETRPYFDQLGEGDHLLGFLADKLVSHLMWVTRWLQPEGHCLLRTAYVEMVATDPMFQHRGFASELLREFPVHVGEYDVAALCPATEELYGRKGWRFWRGPLFTRRNGVPEPTPNERVMLLPLPRTPPLKWDTGLSIEWRPGEVW